MIIEVVKKYLAAGLSVIPVTPDTKQPFLKWKEFQSRTPRLEEIVEFFNNGTASVALVCGRVSGGVVAVSYTHLTLPTIYSV